MSKKKYTTTLNITIPVQSKKIFRALCEMNGMSASYVISEFIYRAINNKKDALSIMERAKINSLKPMSKTVSQMEFESLMLEVEEEEEIERIQRLAEAELLEEKEQENNESKK